MPMRFKLPSSMGWRIGLAILAVLLFVWLAREFGHEFPIFEHWVQEQGSWAPVIYIVAFVVLSVISVSAAVFAVAAGALFGLTRGFAYFIIAEFLSMALLFWIGRCLARDKIERLFKAHPKFDVVDRAVSSHGARMVFLIRLTPVPFSAMSYILSISRVTFIQYMLGGFARAPIVFAEVYVGFTAKHLSELHQRGGPAEWVHYGILGAGLLAAIGVSLYVHKVAKKALAEVESAASTK